MFTVFRLSMNACRECLREPVYYLMLLAALIMIGLFPYFSMFVFRQQIRLVCDYFIFCVTVLMFSATSQWQCRMRRQRKWRKRLRRMDAGSWYISHIALVQRH